MKARYGMMIARSAFFAAGLMLTVCLIAACGGAPATSIPTPAPQTQPTVANVQLQPTIPALPVPTLSSVPGLTGHFVFADGNGSLEVEQAGSNKPQVVFKSSSNLYGDTPVLSADGKLIAFSASSFTKDGSVLEDVRLMNLDGSNMHVVAAPQDPKITYGFPAWSPDGKELYITQSYSVPPASQHDEVDAVSVGGGPLRKIVEGGREASISPDGKKIVYSELDLTTYSSSLWIANIDGSSRKQLLATGTFAAIYGARISPDEQAIVFAESGPATRKLPGVAALNLPPEGSGCAVSIAFVCLAASAEAHGLPWDLYLVTVDGSKFTRLTNIGSDSPVPAWSADGKQIAFFDATGIYMLDVGTKKITQVSYSRGYGGFDWR